jgi:hypothetical protein
VIIPRGAIAASRSNEISMQPDWQPPPSPRIGKSLRQEGQSMRWKIGSRDRAPRQIDLIVILALLIVILAAFRFYNGDSHKPSTTAFIVPSQTVRW